MQISAPLCVECIHEKDSNKLICAAFPGGIPEDILVGDFDHTKLHPDQDNDILFESITKEG